MLADVDAAGAGAGAAGAGAAGVGAEAGAAGAAGAGAGAAGAGAAGVGTEAGAGGARLVLEQGLLGQVLQWWEPRQELLALLVLLAWWAAALVLAWLSGLAAMAACIRACSLGSCSPYSCLDVFWPTLARPMRRTPRDA